MEILLKIYLNDVVIEFQNETYKNIQNYLFV